jgi:hypothetical protein
MDKMDEAKAKVIFSDKPFVTSLLKLDTPEEVQTALKAQGLEASLDEIKTIGDALAKAAEKGGDLSDSDLEKVAGGKLPSWLNFSNVVNFVTGADEIGKLGNWIKKKVGK